MHGKVVFNTSVTYYMDAKQQVLSQSDTTVQSNHGDVGKERRSCGDLHTPSAAAVPISTIRSPSNQRQSVASNNNHNIQRSCTATATRRHQQLTLTSRMSSAHRIVANRVSTIGNKMAADGVKKMQFMAGRIWDLVENREDDGGDASNLRQEVFDVYRHLRRMCHDLRQIRGNEHVETMTMLPEPEAEQDPAQYRVGGLTSVLKELQGLMEDIVKAEIGLMNPEMQQEMESQIHCMKDELSSTRLHLERLKHQMELRDEEIRRKSEELTKLTEKLSLQHRDVTEITQERDRLLDEASGGELAKDEVVRKAREERDEALRKRNQMEIELAKSRVDIMTLNGQLMEAINQKLDLSQQLEQWESDMQVILESQVREKLIEEWSRNQRNRAANNNNNNHWRLPKILTSLGQLRATRFSSSSSSSSSTSSSATASPASLS